MNIQEITYQLLGEKSVTYFDSQKYVNWAITLLENGFDSESLVILAGLDSYDTEEKEKYFWKSIEELNIRIDKTEIELIEIYANFLAIQVVENKINPTIALRKMFNITRATDYTSKYMPFYELDDALDLLQYDNISINDGLTLENKDEYIKEEFELFLEMDKLEIDKSIREKSYCFAIFRLCPPTTLRVTGQ
jgi:hypothetical protein